MRRTIHLLRHGSHAELGRVLSGRSEIPLDERGRQEAEAAARHLADAGIRSIHSSPRRRTRETARPAAEALSLPVRLTPALDEIDFGRLAGRSFADLDGDADWRRWNERRGEARCPDGETMGEAVDRTLAHLLALPADALPALCVSHCDIVRGVACRVLGLPFHRMFALGCDPGSITTLSLDDGDWRLVSLNVRPA